MFHLSFLIISRADFTLLLGAERAANFWQGHNFASRSLHLGAKECGANLRLAFIRASIHHESNTYPGKAVAHVALCAQDQSS